MPIYCWIASITAQNIRLEYILKKAGIVVSFQLPKECLEKNEVYVNTSTGTSATSMNEYVHMYEHVYGYVHIHNPPLNTIH
jgi:hypothetical protein